MSPRTTSPTPGWGLLAAATAALALASAPADAVYCARDTVPASTLLFPVVIVGMANGAPDPAGETTIVRVTNASWQTRLVNVTAWSASGAPVVQVNEVLSGFDVWSMNARDLVSGRFDLFDTSGAADAPPNLGTRAPVSGGPDGGSVIGAAPILPTPDPTSSAPLTGCWFPYGALPSYSVPIINFISASLHPYTHSGCASTVPLTPSDWLSALDAEPLVFYITVDVISACTNGFPSNPGYFSSFYSSNNVLLGQADFLDPAHSTFSSIPAVHLESSPTEGLPVNFYSKVAYAGQEPHVEPLGTALAFRYVDDAASGTSTDLLLWKNTTEASGTTVEDCGRYLYYAWDEDEHVLASSPGPEPDELPLMTQVVPVSSANFSLPAPSGWMMLVVPPSYPSGYADPTPAGPAYGGEQVWGATRLRTATGTSITEAATLANANCFASQTLPGFGLPSAPVLTIQGDANGDSKVSLADVFSLVNHLFGAPRLR